MRIWEKLGGVDIKLFYPKIYVKQENIDTISDLVTKMGSKLTDPQLQFHQFLMSTTSLRGGATAAEYLRDLIDHAENVRNKKRKKEDIPQEIQDVRDMTMNAVIRNLRFVQASLSQMEANNERLRGLLKDFTFSPMPDPKNNPEKDRFSQSGFHFLSCWLRSSRPKHSSFHCSGKSICPPSKTEW